MGILFIVALLLAWPTFGLSLVAWFVLAWFKSQQKAAGINRREELKTVIEPLFQGRFSDFFCALDMPTTSDEGPTEQEAHQCGRHIMNYIAHNPSQAEIFMKGLGKWRTKGSPTLCDPVTAASYEKDLNAKGEIHLVSYRAVEAVMTNNPGMRCFDKISLPLVALSRSTLEVNLFSRKEESPFLEQSASSSLTGNSHYPSSHGSDKQHGVTGANKQRQAASVHAQQHHKQASQSTFPRTSASEKEMPFWPSEQEGINGYDSNGYTALMNAVKSYDLVRVRNLVAKGANTKLKDNNFGTSTASDMAYLALRRATDEDSRDILKRIIMALDGE